MKSDFHDRQERRLDKAQELAEKNRRESTRRYEASKAEVEHIPFGQPILVGHHSERGHRAALKRSDNHTRASIEADKKAGYYRQKAATIENSIEGKGPISSDDPEAVQKIKVKIEKAEKLQGFMKACNSAIRKHKKAGAEAQITALVEVGALFGVNFNENRAQELLKPDFCGRIGFAGYATQNNNANIRRMKGRLADLERQETAETKESEVKGVRFLENPADNRIQIFFDSIPGPEIRTTLKANGFRWAPSVGCWQRHLNNSGRWAGDRVKEFLQR